MKVRFKSLFILTMLLFSCPQAWAQQTLPKGVRFFVYKHIQSSKVNSFYDNQMKDNQLYYKANLDAKTLSDVDIFKTAYFEQLKESNPEAYNKFSAGEWEIQAEAEGMAHGFGLGYGATDDVTLFAIIPYLKVEVKAQTTRTKGNNYAKIQSMVENSRAPKNGALLNANDFLDPNGNTLQSVLVNYYGYKPVGTWRGEGIGDVELGAKIKLLDKKDIDIGTSLGIVLPTGAEDDPDNLQDIPFGKGFFSLYDELDFNYKFNKTFSTNITTKLQYSFSENKVLRAPQDPDYFLSEKKENFKISPGLQWSSSLKFNKALTYWLSAVVGYKYSYQARSTYLSKDEVANSILESQSESEGRSFLAELNFSSIQAYLNESFIAPGNIIFSYEASLGGKNVPNYTLYSIELRSLF